MRAQTGPNCPDSIHLQNGCPPIVKNILAVRIGQSRATVGTERERRHVGLRVHGLPVLRKSKASSISRPCTFTHSASKINPARIQLSGRPSYNRDCPCFRNFSRQPVVPHSASLRTLGRRAPWADFF